MINSTINLPIKEFAIAIKLIFTLFVCIYVGAAYLLVKRVKLMNSNLQTPNSTLIKIMTKLHLIISLIVLLMALMSF